VLAEHIALVERKWRWYYLPIAQPRGHGAWTEHAELIKAIAAGDADLASSIMNGHTERTRQVYSEQRLAKPDE
jgi:DNA-binding GntR family transcriptional regulator